MKVCIDVDAGWRLGLMAIGAKRSPLHDVAHVTNLASAIVARPGLELDGLMAYEAQIAGVGDAPPGKPLLRLALPVVQALSARELARRRAEIVDAVRAIAPLRFVNGGGTGSIERTAAEPAVTEVAAGSGLYGPTLFDTYRAFKPRPAALFALPVVRKPSPKLATVLGGGYPASGAAGRDRLPRPFLPPASSSTRARARARCRRRCAGKAAAGLRVGDRVWFRHAKAGELCERFDVVHLIRGERDRRHRADLPRRGQDLPLRQFAVVVVEVLAEAHERALLRAAGEELDLVRVGVDRVRRVALGREHDEADGLLGGVEDLVRARGADREGRGVAGAEHVGALRDGGR